MSETLQVPEPTTVIVPPPKREPKKAAPKAQKPCKGDAPRVPRPRSVEPQEAENAAFRAWLTALGLHITPTLHINGKSHETAILTVDFGQPLKPIKLDTDQTSELVGRIRNLVRGILNKDATIRISNDGATGIWWASVA